MYIVKKYLKLDGKQKLYYLFAIFDLLDLMYKIF